MDGSPIPMMQAMHDISGWAGALAQILCRFLLVVHGGVSWLVNVLTCIDPPQTNNNNIE